MRSSECVVNYSREEEGPDLIFNVDSKALSRLLHLEISNIILDQTCQINSILGMKETTEYLKASRCCLKSVKSLSSFVATLYNRHNGHRKGV